MGLEARRVLDRLRLATAITDKDVGTFQRELGRVERSVGTVALTRAVLRSAARPMGTPVRTLDAIHLASAMAVQQRRHGHIVFATHESQQTTAAHGVGFECIGR